jgi:hypothetical protein
MPSTIKNGTKGTARRRSSRSPTRDKSGIFVRFMVPSVESFRPRRLKRPLEVAPARKQKTATSGE